MPTSTLDIGSSPRLTVTTGETALAGVSTPFSTGSISGPATAGVVVTITALTGTLATNFLPGVTVSGSGSNALWIAGPPAQVDAALATLVYNAPLAGNDVLTLTLVDPAGQGSQTATVPVTILPLVTALDDAPPTLTIQGGTLTLDSRQLNGLGVDIHDTDNGAGAATLILDDSTLGENVTLTVAATDLTSPAPRLAIAGTVELDGLVTLEPGPALVTIAQNAVLTNQGNIDLVGSSAQFSGTGTLQNDGTLRVGGGADGAGPTIGIAVSGTGLIELGAGSQLELGAPVSADQTICFDANTGTLMLAAPASMQAQIDNFVAGDTIQLGEINIDASDYTQTGNGGTLTLYDGAQVKASLYFAGKHQLSDFVFSVATDSASDGGAITTLSVRAAPAALDTIATDNTNVYRFFDTTSGNQLLTQDPGERDAILATRPDMVFEGTAMQAVASAADDPAATAVYRFFDTTNGTHFFTASEAEKNSLLATRPDLIFEPNSTMLEDATPQPGDVPVYRLFDAAGGSHFYTDSASERANVLAMHPDMKDEGIAFYAPG